MEELDLSKEYAALAARVRQKRSEGRQSVADCPEYGEWVGRLIELERAGAAPKKPVRTPERPPIE